MAAVDNPGLTNVAATLLNLLGFEKVADYDDSLIAPTRVGQRLAVMECF
jgi:hypothetical protein